MWPEPDDPHDGHRMRAAHRAARTALQVRSAPDTHDVWGWRGRTLSRPVLTSHDPAWLRVACRPVEQIDTTFWDGSLAAEDAIPEAVPRPRLRRHHDWTVEPWTYRAELYDKVTTPPIATSPTLRAGPDLSDTWWEAVRRSLEHISSVPTGRYTIEQQYLDQAMPHFLGTPVTTTPATWVTAHGDFHFANLCAPLTILDWEGWGLAPTAYDAATLYIYSLLDPTTAARVRRELAPILDTPAGQFAELVVTTEVLHSNSRGDNRDLAHPVRSLAAYTLGRPVL